MGWRRKDFYINISDYPSIMIAGKDEGILKTILNLIRINMDNRAFDSEIITTIYSESPNAKNKYSNFKNVCDNKSVESVLLVLKQEINQRLKDFEMMGAMNIMQFNEQSQQPMTRRVVIVDGFEDVMENINVRMDF